MSRGSVPGFGRPKQCESAKDLALIREGPPPSGGMPIHMPGARAAFKRLGAGGTLQSLWRLAAWGLIAASALLIAVMATRSDMVARRAVVMASLPSVHVPRPAGSTFDAQAETVRLSDAVRGLAAESDELKSRVGVVEHQMDDVTGSITQQPAATTAAGGKTAQWPNEMPITVTTATVDKMLASSPTPSTQYGVDIGSALSIPTLRARWAGIRSAHPRLFDDLRPVVTLKQLSHSSRVELRLVAGPLASAEAATQLCAALSPYRLFCAPATYSGQSLQ
jgi:hypothetical protein